MLTEEEKAAAKTSTFFSHERRYAPACARSNEG